MAAVEDFSPGSQQDFAGRLASHLGDAVEQLQSKTVVPLFFIGRVVVYGVLAAIIAIMVAILSVDVVVKLLDAYLFGTRVWITYLLVGGISLIAGWFAWRKAGNYRLDAANAKE